MDCRGSRQYIRRRRNCFRCGIERSLHKEMGSTGSFQPVGAMVVLKK